MPHIGIEEPEPPQWETVSEPRRVFRFVKYSDPSCDGFAECFMSDEERGKKALPGEHPDLLTGMSAFVSDGKARKRWAEIKGNALKRRSERNKRRQRPFRMSVGDYIAEVNLKAREGFEICDLGEPDGHLTIRGNKDRLASNVVRVYAAESEPS